MSTRQSIVLLIAVLLTASTVQAQNPPAPTIGIFFDDAGQYPYLLMTESFPATAYICAIQADMMIGGAAFKVEIPSEILLLGSTFRPGLVIGDLQTGAEVGLTTPVPVFGADAGVIAEFIILPPSYPFATLHVLPHDNYATPMLADSLGNMVTAVGQDGWLTHPDPAENASWSEVKNLFK